MKPTTTVLPLLSLLEAGALFGFFYAWVCSTMWGLDAADPRVAIEAMQAMNASVRNAVFAPVFFGTPVVTGITAFVLYRADQSPAALWFALATAVIALLAVLLTMGINVPMNEALAQVAVPTDIDAARAIWLAYSPDWQFWNQLRTATSGLGLLMVGIGIMQVK
ncbi:DUF1772 domain-containing protein [uncultured Sulfitobacter sp.]|uniref:anthrone oxygenase family protein n=1 Tax=uncultured Sulfitobacter sp. TaxID=191468 RepID=UPI00260A8916|nr:anthrone oxygenase family protein [uncultured Sulfitobacter sp.]